MYKSVEVRLGRYEAFQELGRNARRTTYLARDPEIERLLIIKAFERGTADWDDNWASRIAILGELSHDGLVRLLDFHDEAGTTFLVTEYIEGESLEQILSRRKLSEPEAIALTMQLLDVLSYLREKHVAHFNLKPSNILITPEGRLKVTDFGGLGNESAIAFMAPEQLRGAGDERSDLFAVGVILYLMLSGHRPFQGNTDSTIEFKLVHQHPVPVAAMNLELSPELDHIVGRLLAKDPNERYPSASDAKRDLDQVRDGVGPILAITSQEPAGRRSNNSQASSTTRPVQRNATPTSWKFTIPACLAGLAIATFAVSQPFLQTIQQPASIARHIPVPLLSSGHTARSARVSRHTRRTPETSKLAARSPQQAAPSKAASAETVAIPVELQQPFRECSMSIWVDDRVVYSHAIRPDSKKRFLHLGATVSDYMTMVQLPTGQHAIRIEVTDPSGKNNKTGSVSASISQVSGQKLRVRYDRDKPALEAVIN